VPPLATTICPEPVADPVVLATRSVPPPIVVPPEYVLAPLKIRVPVPLLVSPPVPVIVPENVVLAPLPPAVRAKPFRATAPAPARPPTWAAVAKFRVPPVATVTVPGPVAWALFSWRVPAETRVPPA